jgi:hypothetical protein
MVSAARGRPNHCWSIPTSDTPLRALTAASLAHPYLWHPSPRTDDGGVHLAVLVRTRVVDPEGRGGINIAFTIRNMSTSDAKGWFSS